MTLEKIQHSLCGSKIKFSKLGLSDCLFVCLSLCIALSLLFLVLEIPFITKKQKHWHERCEATLALSPSFSVTRILVPKEIKALQGDTVRMFV